MQLQANTAWFTLSLNGRSDFQVYSFTGRESVSRPYMFTLELVNASAAEDLTGFIGGPALLTVYDRSGAPRLVHGLVSEMRRLHRGNHLTHYQCVIVPRLWFLGLTRDHRIFQYKSVTEIITQILEEQGFAAETFAFKCFNTYSPREYCVQYGESDLHFISRLCEEEGIYFYFEHAADGHCLCFSDMAGGPDIPGEADLRYFAGSGQPADTAVISRVLLHSQSVSDKATYRDWNFLTPSSILESSGNEPDFTKAPAAPGIDHDVYRYPYLYRTQAEGERYARLQLLRQLALQTRIEAESDASRFLPGFSFIIHGHDVDAVNAGWWVTAVSHYGEQPQVLGREAPDRELRYTAEVTAIPEKTRFVPALEHAKNRVMGDQTAIVAGPEGEEIYPDAHGRVKVQFFWDREGQGDENATCWIRVSQGWAGTEFGAMAIPRIGHEVIVSFLEGDPDRPIITGRMHHAQTMPPYVLPDHKTRTVFKSMSTPGGDGPRGFNELSVEDKAGEEEIYLHGEKDVNGHVKHVWKEHILHDKHRTVDRHAYARTEGETHETLRENRKTEQHADDSLTVHGSSHTKVDHKWLRKVGADVHLYAGDKAVFEAGTEATLKGGGSWMQFDAGGVFAGGSTIRLGGGGSAGSRKGAAPLLPVMARQVEEGLEPGARQSTLEILGGSDASVDETLAALKHAFMDVLGGLTKDPYAMTPHERCALAEQLLTNKKLSKEIEAVKLKSRNDDAEYQGWIIESSPGEYHVAGVHTDGEKYSVSIGEKPQNAIVTFHTHAPGVSGNLSNRDEYAAAVDKDKTVLYMIFTTDSQGLGLDEVTIYQGDGMEIDCHKILHPEEY